jgi:hypothetical protein
MMGIQHNFQEFIMSSDFSPDSINKDRGVPQVAEHLPSKHKAWVQSAVLQKNKANSSSKMVTDSTQIL